MFYNEAVAIKACEENPALIFELMKEDHLALVDKLLSRKKVNINTTDEMGNDILTRLLKMKRFDLVSKHMKNKEWNVNHQNNEGDTFAHILVTINYKYIVDIIKQLKRNTNYMPNIKNNKGETILDKSINNDYIYTTIKILEDSRFNNIDIISFKNLYETYIKSNNYGKYSKLNNLEIIIDTLEEKKLLPTMQKVMNNISKNIDLIKEAIVSDDISTVDKVINYSLETSNV